MKFSFFIEFLSNIHRHTYMYSKYIAFVKKITRRGIKRNIVVDIMVIIVVDIIVKRE